jgi:alanyl-tRNA synthetase
MKRVSMKQEMRSKKTGRKAGAVDTEDWIQVNEGSNNEFVGYDSLETEASVLKYRKVKAKGKEAYQLVLTKPLFMQKAADRLVIRANCFLEMKK